MPLGRRIWYKSRLDSALTFTSRPVHVLLLNKLAYFSYLRVSDFFEPKHEQKRPPRPDHAMSQGFSWASAACTALSSFESPSGPFLILFPPISTELKRGSMFPGVHSQTQLPITLPQSSYDPLFSTTSLFDFALDQRLAPSNDHSGYAPGRTAIDHEQQQRNLWGGFTLNQGFSEHAQASSGFEDQGSLFGFCGKCECSLFYHSRHVVSVFTNALTKRNDHRPHL